MKIILASSSPRRSEILKKAGYEFEVITSDFVEIKDGKNPSAIAQENALGKAKNVFEKIKNTALCSDHVVLGADTIVLYGEKILGKPKDLEKAKTMLEMLSDKTHVVISGYAIVSGGGVFTGYDKSEVTFNKLSSDLIERYVNITKPLDKAGAYGIQDEFPIVKNYSGSLLNIIGLPLEKIEQTLKENFNL